jgi:hypothetical protein
MRKSTEISVTKPENSSIGRKALRVIRKYKFDISVTSVGKK